MKTSDKFIAPLNEWNNYIAERGRGSGNAMSIRDVITCDRMNLILAKERKGYPPVGYKFCTKITHFLDTVWQETRTPRETTLDLLNKGMAAAFETTPADFSGVKTEQEKIGVLKEKFNRNFEYLFI